MVAFIDEFGTIDPQLYYHKKMKTDETIAKTCIQEAIGIFEKLDDFSETSIHDALVNRCEELGMKKGQMLFTVRVALTGCASTPGGAVEMADILGKDESLRRLKEALGQLQ